MKELWKQAEDLTAEYFGLTLTSGSGRGQDKQDSKDADWRAETKSYQSKSYALNHEKFREWRRNANRLGQNLFLHIVPVIDGKPSMEESMIVLSPRVFRTLIKEDECL